MNRVGNKELQARLMSDKSDSFVLSGIRGIGKFQMALAKAKLILCLTKDVNCRCDSCRKFDAGKHPDLVVSDKISKDAVSQIDFFSNPVISKKKV